MPPFKVYKVMQDINQQLYERKSTPEGFIPVYGVVVTVPTGIYINGQKEFTCDKTFDEVKEDIACELPPECQDLLEHLVEVPDMQQMECEDYEELLEEMEV